METKIFPSQRTKAKEASNSINFFYYYLFEKKLGR